MPRLYSGIFTSVTNGSNLTLISIEEATGTNVQVEIFEIMIGSQSTPAANAALYVCGRTTADGTVGTTPTVGKLNPDSVASLSTLRMGAYTAEPTYEAPYLWELPLNMQATYRWVVQPGLGFGLYANHAAATDGMGLRSVSASTAYAVSGHIMWAE